MSASSRRKHRCMLTARTCEYELASSPPTHPHSKKSIHSCVNLHRLCFIYLNKKCQHANCSHVGFLSVVLMDTTLHCSILQCTTEIKELILFLHWFLLEFEIGSRVGICMCYINGDRCKAQNGTMTDGSQTNSSIDPLVCKISYL